MPPTFFLYYAICTEILPPYSLFIKFYNLNTRSLQNNDPYELETHRGAFAFMADILKKKMVAGGAATAIGNTPLNSLCCNHKLEP